MIKIKNVSIKNFLSFGNVTQALSFSDNELFLILGENIDQGGNDYKNGVGKSGMAAALSYGLFGKPLASIKLENLINKTNGKGMIVTVEFEKNGTQYRIERGRKPNIFKFLVDNAPYANSTEDNETDDIQGEGRHTQDEIERILGMSHDMFKHLVMLNTSTEPFLSMRVADQRTIIEQLLGITKLSEKADLLKSVIKDTKDKITREEFKISAIKEANKKIEANITSLERRSTLWQQEHNKTIAELTDTLTQLEAIEINAEIEKHNQNATAATLKTEFANLQREESNISQKLQSTKIHFNKLADSLEVTSTMSCPECKQGIDSHIHEEMFARISEQLESMSSLIEADEIVLNHLHSKIAAFIIPVIQKTFYKKIDEAYEHKSKIETLMSRLERELELTNPYLENIESLRKESLQEIEYETINALIKEKEHQEFLLKLLTNKDSFIRKKIIKQNLTYLNNLLSIYLSKMGLPHKVEFLPDLSVAISEHGRDLDFDNLSRGEKTRLILSLSWAFRGVYESMNDKINLLYIDELIDNGLDGSGVESALGILKKMAREDKRCVHLISHREELINRVDNIIKVVKENGFTSIMVEED